MFAGASAKDYCHSKFIFHIIYILLVERKQSRPTGVKINFVSNIPLLTCGLDTLASNARYSTTNYQLQFTTYHSPTISISNSNSTPCFSFTVFCTS